LIQKKLKNSNKAKAIKLKRYNRFCPECHKELFYSSLSSFNNAKRNNSLCYSCRKGQSHPHSDEWKKELSIRQKYHPFAYGNKNKNRNDFYEKRLCLYCKSEFECLKRSNKKFCTYPCAMTYRFKNEKVSQPELVVKNWLDEFFIKYKWQHSLEGRFFDFYLPEINTLIEINGTYHHAKNIEAFEYMDKIQKRTRYNDLIKNEIAYKNDILLIRIWHDEINKLHKILEESCI